MKTISFANQKGGVAKTTTVFNVGCGAAMSGLKVLLIDCDAQGSLTLATGIDPGGLPPEKTLFGVLTSSTDVTSAILNIENNIDIIPSNFYLCTADLTLAGVMYRELLLKKAIEGLEYDLILIDCPPALNLVTLNAFAASDCVYIPVEPEIYGIKGTSMLLDTIERVKQGINTSIDVSGVIITRYNKRLNITKECERILIEKFGEKVCNTRIRVNSKIKETVVFNKSIFTHSPKSMGAVDYNNLVSEILEREGLNGGQ